VLSKLVPHLSEADRPRVLTSAWKATLKVSDEPEATKMWEPEDMRVEWLARLAPHLAWLDASQSAESESKIRIIDLLKGLTRPNALRVLEAAAAPVALLGGEEATLACCEAVGDVARWWP
jgi:hypothetical protein